MATRAEVSIIIRAKNLAKGTVTRLRAQFQGLGRLISRAFKVVAVAGIAAFTAAIVGAIVKAAQFEQVMAEVSTLLDTSTVDVAQLSREIVNLSRVLPSTATELGAGLYQTISAGITDTSEALEVLEVATRASVGGVTDTKTAVDGITSSLNAFGMEAGQATDVADAFFTAVVAGKTTFGELAASIGMVAPLAAVTGTSLDELLAATATLTTSGLSTSQAMTGLRGILAEIIKPGENTKKMAKELGIEFNIGAVRAKGFAAFIDDLRVKTGGSTTKLGQMFGRVEALSALLSLTGTHAGQFADILAQMELKAGAAKAAFEKMNQTLKNQFILFKNNLTAVLIQIGTELIPGLIDGLKRAREAFGELGRQVTANKDFFKGLGEQIGNLVAEMIELIPVMIRMFGVVIETTAKVVRVITSNPTMAQFGLIGFVFMGPAGIAVFATLGLGIDKLIGKLVGPTTPLGATNERIERFLALMNSLNQLRDRVAKGLRADLLPGVAEQFGVDATQTAVLAAIDERIASAADGIALAGRTVVKFGDEFRAEMERDENAIGGLLDRLEEMGRQLQDIPLDLLAVKIPVELVIAPLTLKEQIEAFIAANQEALEIDPALIEIDPVRIPEPPTQSFQSFGDLLKTIVQTFSEVGAGGLLFVEIAGRIVTAMIDGLANAFTDAFEAMADGSKSFGAAFAGAMLEAIASVSKALGKMFLAEALAAVARGILGDPRGFAAAAKFTAAAVAMFAVAGLASAGAAGGGGGGGGGGVGAGIADTGSDLSELGGATTIILTGSNILDMNDPAMQERFARAIRESTGRRVTVRVLGRD